MKRAAKASAAPGRRDPVRISRPDKVLFPADGITKRDLVEYYERIASTMLPYLEDRPIAMERFPDGIHAGGFFQKKAGAHFPSWLRTVSLPKRGGTVRYVICDNAESLVYLANQAVITPHAWLSRSGQPHHPDQMIFDLDPSKDDFAAVCLEARRLRKILKEHGLTSFVKTTGSRGLHVLVPLDRSANFEDVRAFAQTIAERLAQEDPEHVTTEVRKNKRAGRIFVDIARNAYAQTAAPPYAVRPRDGAPVASPLVWEELEDRKLRPDQFNIRNVFDRLKDLGDPWAGIGKRAQRLPASKAA
jgi:bifunctional non-homologous end joining protein LigD